MAIKRSKQVESLMSKLEDIRLAFEDMVSSREDYHSEKSEKWQDSDKGSEYEEDTTELSNIVESLESAYNDIENLFEES